MSNNQNPGGHDAPLLHPDHPKPKSRRDFLSQGFISGAAFVTMPSLLQMVVNPTTAHALTAQDCGVNVGGGGRIPFLCFDLAGGASVAGSNAMVGGMGGQLDFISAAGYQKLGLPSDMLPSLPGQLNTELGLAFHSDSGFLRGILSKTSTATRANINGTVIAARSSNDTGNNPHNPMYGINKAGAQGNLLTLIGTENSESGGKSRAPDSMVDLSVRPTKVDRPSDATGLVDTGKLIELLEPDDAASVMLAIERISELKLQKMTESQMIQDLVQCGYIQSTDLVSRFGDPALLDPLLDPAIAGLADSIFSDNELDQSKFLKTATVMKLVISGSAGAGTIELGGYDYHNGTRSRGEVRDFEAGQAMGAALEYAARIGQPLMLYVFSDGSVASNGTIDDSNDGRGKGEWSNDQSTTAATFILVYDPAGQPALATPTSSQIGYFRDSGDVETAANRVANNVDTLAESIVLNYLALHDEVGRIDMVLPGHSLGAGADLDSLVAFQPIRMAT
jgi:hypothetical protein